MNTLLEDNSGGASVIRAIALSWTICLLGQWLKASIGSPGIPDLPDNVVELSLVIYGSKALQRFGEKATPEKEAPSE